MQLQKVTVHQKCFSNIYFLHHFINSMMCKIQRRISQVLPKYSQSLYHCYRLIINSKLRCSRMMAVISDYLNSSIEALQHSLMGQDGFVATPSDYGKDTSTEEGFFFSILVCRQCRGCLTIFITIYPLKSRQYIQNILSLLLYSMHFFYQNVDGRYS